MIIMVDFFNGLFSFLYISPSLAMYFQKKNKLYNKEQRTKNKYIQLFFFISNMGVIQLDPGDQQTYLASQILLKTQSFADEKFTQQNLVNFCLEPFFDAHIQVFLPLLQEKSIKYFKYEHSLRYNCNVYQIKYGTETRKFFVFQIKQAYLMIKQDKENRLQLPQLNELTADNLYEWMGARTKYTWHDNQNNNNTAYVSSIPVDVVDPESKLWWAKLDPNKQLVTTTPDHFNSQELPIDDKIWFQLFGNTVDQAMFFNSQVTQRLIPSDFKQMYPDLCTKFGLEISDDTAILMGLVGKSTNMIRVLSLNGWTLWFELRGKIFHLTDEELGEIFQTGATLERIKSQLFDLGTNADSFSIEDRNWWDIIEKNEQFLFWYKVLPSPVELAHMMKVWSLVQDPNAMASKFLMKDQTLDELSSQLQNGLSYWQSLPSPTPNKETPLPSNQCQVLYDNKSVSTLPLMIRWCGSNFYICQIREAQLVWTWDVMISLRFKSNNTEDYVKLVSISNMPSKNLKSYIGLKESDQESQFYRIFIPSDVTSEAAQLWWASRPVDDDNDVNSFKPISTNEACNAQFSSDWAKRWCRVSQPIRAMTRRHLKILIQYRPSEIVRMMQQAGWSWILIACVLFTMTQMLTELAQHKSVRLAYLKSSQSFHALMIKLVPRKILTVLQQTDSKRL
jgi:hypothetical protein